MSNLDAKNILKSRLLHAALLVGLLLWGLYEEMKSVSDGFMLALYTMPLVIAIVAIIFAIARKHYILFDFLSRDRHVIGGRKRPAVLRVIGIIYFAAGLILTLCLFGKDTYGYLPFSLGVHIPVYYGSKFDKGEGVLKLSAVALSFLAAAGIVIYGRHDPDTTQVWFVAIACVVLWNFVRDYAKAGNPNVFRLRKRRTRRRP